MKTLSRLTLACSVALSMPVAGAFAQTASEIVADPSYDGGQQTYEQRYVTTGVNLRAGPGTGFDVIGTLDQGDFVNVAGCQNGWCSVNAGDRPDGYVAARYIGEGENPHNDRGPLSPSVPEQEAGTDGANGQTYGDDMLVAPGSDTRSMSGDMLPSAEVSAFQRVQDRLGYRDARIAWSERNCALYRAIGPDDDLYEEPLRTRSGDRICQN